jgi:DNA-binding XRE family transcriptional regulator
MGRKPKAQEEQIISSIEQFRVLAGLSRQELADAVDVHYQTIGYIERGEYSPSLVLALKFAKVLNVSVEDIFQLGELK